MDETRAVDPAPDLDDLAAEYLMRASAGENPAVTSYLARLPAEQHDTFRELVRGAAAAQAALPRTLGPETLLAGRYRVIEEIGAGGMGKVFRAFDERLERTVAVKVLGTLQQQDPESRALLLKESRLLATLQHPNIVAVHESGQDGDIDFLVMDLVDGTCLSTVIDRARSSLQRRTGQRALSPRDGELLAEAIGKPLPDGRSDLLDAKSWYRSVGRVALEIARTLEAAHAQGVVHRDLKPNNLMLLGGGTPVVLDFGLAGNAHQPAGEVTRGLYGTVAYLAPEQARTHTVGTDPRTDVYQVGLVLYELLTLHRAFPGEGLSTVLESIKAGLFQAPRRLNRAIPRALEAICLKAIELRPERRYATARELREDLECYVEDRGNPVALRSDRVRAVARNGRYLVRRHPVLAAIAGMVLVGVTVAALLRPELDLGVETAWIRPLEGELGPITLKADQVGLDDTIGVRVSVPDEGAYVYALSVYGSDARLERTVYPLKPRLLKDFPQRAEEEIARTKTWDLPLDGGVHDVACTVVQEIIEDVDYEGLLVLATPRPDPVYEEWMTLVKAAIADGSEVSYGQAIGMLRDTADGARGGDIGELSPADRARYGRTSTQILERGQWEADEPAPFEVECRVRRSDG